MSVAWNCERKGNGMTVESGILDFLFAMLLLSLRRHELIRFDVWIPKWLRNSSEEL